MFYIRHTGNPITPTLQYPMIWFTSMNLVLPEKEAAFLTPSSWRRTKVSGYIRSALASHKD